MMRIIPKETQDFIEDKLHGYAEIERKIEEWELSVKYPENKQTAPGAGYIGDPTANQAVKLASPPDYICELIKWRELIDETREFCRQRGNKIFDIWYGQKRQRAIQAYTKNDIHKKTFERNCYKAISFLLFRAMDAGLCGLYNNETDKNAAI